MRLRVYVFGSLLLWVALFVRLSILQVVSGGEYKKIAEVQHKAEVEIAAERGRIFHKRIECSLVIIPADHLSSTSPVKSLIISLNGK